MSADIFSSILEELSKELHVPLHADQHNACRLRLGTIEVQIELDTTAENIIVGSTLGQVPPGRYRESVFTEALKANSAPAPNYGTFAYSKQTDAIVLLDTLPVKEANGAQVASHLKIFIAKATFWNRALAQGEVPILPTIGLK